MSNTSCCKRPGDAQSKVQMADSEIGMTIPLFGMVSFTIVRLFLKAGMRPVLHSNDKLATWFPSIKGSLGVQIPAIYKILCECEQVCTVLAK